MRYLYDAHTCTSGSSSAALQAGAATVAVAYERLRGQLCEGQFLLLVAH